MQSSDTQGEPEFDAILRFIHGWNAASILGLIFSGLAAEKFAQEPWQSLLQQWHMDTGYALIGGVAARIGWAIVGPKTARFADLWHPKAWLKMILTLRRPQHRFGHDALASVLFIAVYLALLVLLGTGLVIADAAYDSGPLVDLIDNAVELAPGFGEIHRRLSILIIAFVILHLAAMLFHAAKGDSVASAMITGRRRERSTEVTDDAGRKSR